MADYWTQGSFAFQCTQAERALLDEAFAAAQLLCRGEDAGEPSSALLAAVPPQAGGPPWGGFVTLFPDPEFPHFGAVLASEAVADDPSCAEIVISGAEAFELEAIAAVVQRCCAETLAKKPIGFEWADSCSRARPDAFGGGWCAIFADRIEFETTGEALSAALGGGIV